MNRGLPTGPAPPENKDCDPLMDPLTQGVLGAALPQAVRRRTQAGVAGALGFFSGMAADLDILIRSESDPLIYLEYHRQFTHSLVFIPVGGLIMAAVLHWILGRRWGLGFGRTVLFCTLGYATHALLDSATSYGTQLLWPFTDYRVAWNIISIIDPLFTLPMLGLVLAAALTGRPALARVALAWGAVYLSLGFMQQQSALAMGREIAAERGHAPVRLEAKPSFGNLLVWKIIYEADGRYHVDAVRATVAPRVFPGRSTRKLDIGRDLPWLDPASQQARDIERFRWFSDDFISQDETHPNRIIDMRYSLVPNEIRPLWWIALDPGAAPDAHADFVTNRGDGSARFTGLWRMIVGTGE